MLRTASTPATTTNVEAELDNLATAMLKSNSRPHICMLLQPLAPGLAQFADETSRKCEFMERVRGNEAEPELNKDELFNRCGSWRPRLCNSQQVYACPIILKMSLDT